MSTIQQVYRICDMAEKMRTVIPAGNQATGDNADYGIVYAYISYIIHLPTI